MQHFEKELNRPIGPEQICVIGKRRVTMCNGRPTFTFLMYDFLSLGDRLMTDIVFANQYGMKSVLVEPLTYVRDHPAAVVIR